MTIAQILNELPSGARGDAIWLFSSLLKISQSDLLLRSRDSLSPGQLKKWKTWWKRWKKGEPLQYIAGEAPFFGREFLVNPKVLIPRPETERLVELAMELAIDLAKKQPGVRVLDIGTGSGAIALTLKLEFPELEVVGSDVSAAAIQVAKKNAARLAAEKVRLEKHDLFSTKLRKERWDIVISNPPYLEFGRDHIAKNVRAWEPRMALEPSLSAKDKNVKERAAWCGEKILSACAENRPLYTALELSPRVALYLERRWRKNPAVKRVWRESDLAGRKRFLLVAWNERS